LSFNRFKKTMAKELKLILKEQPVGREETPWLDPQREKFARVARECSQAFRHSKLRGAAKIMAMNRWMSERL
ncbi:unnamed protein product, partial [marine sediment metagenome]